MYLDLDELPGVLDPSRSTRPGARAGRFRRADFMGDPPGEVRPRRRRGRDWPAPPGLSAC
jgi:hypothetical protein